MPQLKQISCCIEWSDTSAPFQEYGTHYGDGVVESFIVVPTHAQDFCVRLTSRGYIHEGLAMVVFIDGNYQCNRSRLNLLSPTKDKPSNRTEVDFLLRQQEKPQGDGMYMGRAWRFDNHNIVSEAPEGFQESHFDDLGTIEVLVLRCRARNREDADYEGSSSGEDSDIFEERPARDEKVGIPSTTRPDSSQIPAQGSTVIEDEPGLFGMIGLFDGANDIYEPTTRGDTYRDRRSGQWIWHQRQTPQALPPDVPPSFYAAPDIHFRTTSHAPPSAYHPHHQPNPYPTSQSSKQVHFDFGRARESRHHDHYEQNPQSSHQQRYRYSERPPSRERVRSSDRRRIDSPPPRPLTPPGGPYEPQSVDANYHNKLHADSHTTRNQSTTQSSYHDNNPAAWTRNDGSQENREARSRDTVQASRPRQPVHDRQAASQPYGYAQSQPINLREQYAYHGQTHLPHLNRPGHMPPYFHHQAPEYSIAPPPPPPASMFPPHAPVVPPMAPPYPPQTMLPPSYAQPGAYPYPYWPHHCPGPYAYPEVRNSSASQVHDEEISPKNTTHDIAPANEDGQGTSGITSNPNGDTAWANDINDTNSNTGNVNQDDAGNWNATENTENANGNSWDTNTANNGGNDAWDTQKDNSNSNNDGWGNDAANNNATTTWDNNNDTQPSNNQKPDSGATEEAVQRAEPDMVTLANAARDLYGPHGPYYSFRALRLDEPKPDAHEEPRYDVPKQLALARGSTKQVQPGPGYRYYKRRLEPEYIDTMDHPYARFVFKYRTKEQLADEIGITVDVEPSGDQEIQDLQNLDKQALIEMLMRAKTALGGKVPSPPPTPSTPATASDLGPVVVEAPKLPYLKYSLPPLRPGNFSKKSTPSNSAAGSKTSLVGKENIAPTQDGNNGSWNNSANDSNDWDGGHNTNGNNSGDWNTNQSRQNSSSSAAQRAPAREEPADNNAPLRPVTPDNWGSAGDGNTAGNWNTTGQNNAPAGNW